MSQSSSIDRSETPKPRSRNSTSKPTVTIVTPSKLPTTARPKLRSTGSSGRNLRFDLGGLPYIVTECDDERLGWHSAYVEVTGFGILPTLRLESTRQGGEGSRGTTVEEIVKRKMVMDEITVEFAERSGLVVGSSVGGRGFAFGSKDTMETRIEKGEDLIAERDISIVFGWPGLPLVQASPIPRQLPDGHLTRTQLASLISSLITSYFTWATTLDYTQGIIPYIPWEYDSAPHAFLGRYIRCLRLVKLGEGEAWTPVLGGRGLRIKDGRWDIPRCAECERGECTKAFEHP